MFGGVERVENALRIDDARAIVDDVYFNAVIMMTGSNGDPSALAGLLDGIVGVIQNIQKNLLQLLSVSQRGRQRFIKLLQHLHAVTSEIVAAQLDGLAQYIVHTDKLALHRALARKTQQVLNDILGALRLLQNDLQIFASRGRHFGILE